MYVKQLLLHLNICFDYKVTRGSDKDFFEVIKDLHYTFEIASNPSYS